MSGLIRPLSFFIQSSGCSYEANFIISNRAVACSQHQNVLVIGKMAVCRSIAANILCTEMKRVRASRPPA